VPEQNERATVVDIERYRAKAERRRRPLLDLVDRPRPMLRSPFRALTSRELEHRARMLDHMRKR
jgi:hypothetical protein